APRPTSRCSGRRFASSEIGAILKAGFGSMVFPIYDGGAAERQDVGRRLINVVLDLQAASFYTSGRAISAILSTSPRRMVVSAANVPPDNLSWPSDQEAATMTVQDWLQFYALRRYREHDATLLALQATALAIQPSCTAL